MLALAMVAGKSFNGKFTEHWFSDRILYITVADVNIGSLVPHADEIWTKSYGPNNTNFWAFWQKMVNHFWQSVNAILEDVSVTETIVWC